MKNIKAERKKEKCSKKKTKTKNKSIMLKKERRGLGWVGEERKKSGPALSG